MKKRAARNATCRNAVFLEACPTQKSELICFRCLYSRWWFRYSSNLTSCCQYLRIFVARILFHDFQLATYDFQVSTQKQKTLGQKGPKKVPQRLERIAVDRSVDSYRNFFPKKNGSTAICLTFITARAVNGGKCFHFP